MIVIMNYQKWSKPATAVLEAFLKFIRFGIHALFRYLQPSLVRVNRSRRVSTLRSPPVMASSVLLSLPWSPMTTARSTRPELEILNLPTRPSCHSSRAYLASIDVGVRETICAGSAVGEASPRSSEAFSPSSSASPENPRRSLSHLMESRRRCQATNSRRRCRTNAGRSCFFVFPGFSASLSPPSTASWRLLRGRYLFSSFSIGIKAGIVCRWTASRFASLPFSRLRRT